MASYTDYASSSKGFLGGLPTAAEFVERLDPADIIEAATSAAVESGNESLKKSMEQDYKWAPFVGMIEIEWDGEEFVYNITTDDEEEREAIVGIEYGTEDQPPTGFLRKHALRLGDATSKVVQGKVNEVIGLGS